MIAQQARGFKSDDGPRWGFAGNRFSLYREIMTRIERTLSLVFNRALCDPVAIDFVNPRTYSDYGFGLPGKLLTSRHCGGDSPGVLDAGFDGTFHSLLFGELECMASSGN